MRKKYDFYMFGDIADYDNVGIDRSRDYLCLSYKEVLELHAIPDDLFINAKTDYFQKVKNYADHEMFLVPQQLPEFMSEPVHYSNGEKKALNLSSMKLISEFCQFLYGPILSKRNSLKKEGDLLAAVNKINVLEYNESHKEEILKWTKQYGLLFTETLPKYVFDREIVAQNSSLAYSDALYNLICSEYKKVPYFLGLQAFFELYREANKLFWGSWLYVKESRRELAAGADEIIAAYECLLSKEKVNPDIDQIVGVESGCTDEMRLQYVRNLALRELIYRASNWIRIILKAQPSDALELGPKYSAKSKNLAPVVSCQCQDLFSCIMLQHLSIVQYRSKYKICSNCKEIFSVGTQQNVKFCSHGEGLDGKNCHDEFHNKKKYHRRKVARKKSL